MVFCSANEGPRCTNRVVLNHEGNTVCKTESHSLPRKRLDMKSNSSEVLRQGLNKRKKGRKNITKNKKKQRRDNASGKIRGKRSTTEFKFQSLFKVVYVNVETMMNGKKIFQSNI